MLTLIAFIAILQIKTTFPDVKTETDAKHFTHSINFLMYYLGK